jgi:hypothetical protein
MGDVLKVLLAQIGELDAYLAPHLIVGRGRDTHAARFCDALKPRRDIDAISKDVVRLDDHVTDIDADAESNARLFRLADCKFLYAGLELHGSSNSFDRARKLRQDPVTSILHDAPAVLGDCRVDSLGQERGEPGVRSFFVAMHEPRITSHIGSQYRRQSALDPDWPLLHHGPQSNSAHLYDG